MGTADLRKLGLCQEKPAYFSLKVQLREDVALARRRVKGWLNVKLRWRPKGTDENAEIPLKEAHAKDFTGSSCPASTAAMFSSAVGVPPLVGKLTVEVESAGNLLNLDEKTSGLSDPFVCVTVQPWHGDMPAREVWETSVVEDSLYPVWNESKSFVIDWR